jgi:thiamine pyrophosphokinase
MKLEATVQKLKNQLKSTKSALLVGPRPLERPIPQDKNALLIVDGGMNHWAQKPPSSVLIGDGDSCQAGFDQTLFDLLLPTNKDRSDLAYALSLLPENLQNLELLGFGGGRFDHQLVVLGELYSFLKTHLQCHLKLGHEILGLPKGTHHLELSGQFSVLALETLCLTLKGDVEYPTDQLTLSAFSSHGLSNVASGELRIESNQPLFIYSCPSS